MEHTEHLTFHLSSNEWQENGVELQLTVRVEGDAAGNVFATLEAMSMDDAAILKTNTANPHKHPLWALGERMVAHWATEDVLHTIAYESPGFEEYRNRIHDEMRMDRERYRGLVL